MTDQIVEKTEEQKLIDQAAELEQQSMLSNSDITRQALDNPDPFLPDEPIINEEIPTPDAPPGSAQSNGVVSPDKIQEDLDLLNNDIDNAKLEDGKTPQSIASFEGLKSRYKNTISGLKEEVARYKEKEAQIELEREEILSKKQIHTSVDDLTSKNESFAKENIELKKQLEEALPYVRKYDAEADPVLQHKYLKPAAEFKSRATDILGKYILETDVPNTLKNLVQLSEADLNQQIDDLGITGLNASALKSHVENTQIIEHEYNQITSPENIEETLKNSKGQLIRISDEVAANTFENVKTSFSDHIKEIQYSEYNKEHNHFVHDKVVEKAESTFNVLRSAVAPGNQSEEVMQRLATIAISASAYPYNNTLLSSALETITALKEQLQEQSSGSGINQTTEAPAAPAFDIGEIENFSNMSNKELTKDLF